MPSNCPHCEKPIESLSGFVPQKTLEERINAKQGEIDAMTTELTTTRAKAVDYDAVASERDTLKVEMGTLRESTTRTGLLRTASIDEGLLPHFETMLASANASLETPQDFEAWFAAGAREHPILAHLFTATDTPPATPPTNGAPTTPPNNLPTTPPASDPPGPGGKILPADTAAFMGSAEYKGKTVEEKRKWLDEREALVGAQGGA